MVESITTMKKAVQFGTVEQVETIEVDSLKEYTSIWWARHEVREIEDESETLLHFMNMSGDYNNHPIEVDASIHTIRGLEKRTEIGAWEVYEAQRDARNAVLNQQDKHRKVVQQQQRSKSPTKRISTAPGISSSSSSSFELHSIMQIHDMQEAIAKVYRVATLNARRAAFEIGLKDQFEAKRCLSSGDNNIVAVTAMNQPNVTSVRNPIKRESSKVIVMTSEPMCPINQSFRKISKPLMEGSVADDNNNITNTDMPSNLPHCSEKVVLPSFDEQVDNHNIDRIGFAPRVRIGISPMKKRRPKLVLEKTSAVLLSAQTIATTETPRDIKEDVIKRRSSSPRKKRNELLMKLDILHQDVEKSEAVVLDTTTPVRRKKTLKTKVDDSIIPLDVHTIPKLQDNDTMAEKSETVVLNTTPVRRKKTIKTKVSDTTIALDEHIIPKLSEAVVLDTTPVRRKKTIKTKANDSTITLDEHGIPKLQDINTMAAIVTKTKKKKKKKSSPSKIVSDSGDETRKSPKRTSSRDSSSKGSCTVDTEIIEFDRSLSSWDGSFEFFETGVCKCYYDNNNNSCRSDFQFDTTTIKAQQHRHQSSSLHDSFITL